MLLVQMVACLVTAVHSEVILLLCNLGLPAELLLGVHRSRMHLEDREQLFAWHYLAGLWLLRGRVRVLGALGFGGFEVEVVGAVFDLIQDLPLLFQMLDDCLPLNLLATWPGRLAGLGVDVKHRLLVEVLDGYVHVLVHFENVLVHLYFLLPFCHCSVLKFHGIALQVTASLDDESRLEVNEGARCRYEHLYSEALRLEQEIRVKHSALLLKGSLDSLFSSYNRCRV